MVGLIVLALDFIRFPYSIEKGGRAGCLLRFNLVFSLIVGLTRARYTKSG